MSLTSIVRGIIRERALGNGPGDSRDNRVTRDEAQWLIPDEATIARLRRFSLNHGLRPVDGLVGEHRSRRKGSAPEFSDYAPYTPGDDVRRIDWNAYARFDTLYVRESEITTELDVHLLVDTSASMNWTGDSRRDTKLQMARRISAVLSWIALARSDRVSITGFTDTIAETFGTLQGRGMVVPAATHLAGLNGGGESSLVDSVETYIVGRPRAGVMIVMSDLIGLSAEDLDALLASLSNHRWRAALIHIQDPLESEPVGLASAQDVVEIEDLETGIRQRVNMRSDTLRRYTLAREHWLMDLRATATRRSVPLVTVDTAMRIDPDVLLKLERAEVVLS